MKKKSTIKEPVMKKNTTIGPKDSTIALLMNFARVYNCGNTSLTSTGGYILN